MQVSWMGRKKSPENIWTKIIENSFKKLIMLIIEQKLTHYLKAMVSEVVMRCLGFDEDFSSFEDH